VFPGIGRKPFEWRVRDAKLHPWKQAPEDVFARVCESLNQIGEIGYSFTEVVLVCLRHL
jgi:hypothetical protein